MVIGFGPCGIFAALILAQMGLRPIVLERGKPVRERTKDTWGLWRQGLLDPESNVQFGEGGAGTFSDGKLWSQISDPRHLTRKVLTEFVQAGAPEEILYVAKPHIGTFRLVSMVEKMRSQIEALGGEIRFRQPVVDLHIEDCLLYTSFGRDVDVEVVQPQAGTGRHQVFDGLHLGCAGVPARADGAGHACVADSLRRDRDVHRNGQVDAAKDDAGIGRRGAQGQLHALPAVHALSLIHI